MSLISMTHSALPHRWTGLAGSLRHRILRRNLPGTTSTRRNILRAHIFHSIETLEARVLLSADVGLGLQAQYFNTPDLSGPAIIRVESVVDFDWGVASPDAAIAGDEFSARWSGEVESRFTESYNFHIDADEGARLWVNGQLLIDQFDAGGLVDVIGSIELIAGRRYDILMEYREATGDASVSLQWSSVSQPLEVIPSSQLIPAVRGGITADFFAAVSGTMVSDLTADSSYPFAPTSSETLTTFRANSNVGDQFGRRLSGLLHAPISGAYEFFIAADESAELWLSSSEDAGAKQKIAYVNSPVSPLDWTANSEQRSSLIYLAAGQTYFIEAIHKESAGSDHLSVAWRLPDHATIDVIPGEALSAVRPTVRIYADEPTVSESSGASASFTVVRDGQSNQSPLTVHYVTSGTALGGTDYTLLPGTIIIPSGQNSATLDVSPLVDSVDEDEESVIIELRSDATYQVGFKSERIVHAAIQDDSPLPAGSTSLWTGVALSDFNQKFGATFTNQNDAQFGTVIQAEVSNTPVSIFSVQMGQTIDAAVEQGDLLVVEFYAQSVDGPGETLAVFEVNGSPYTQSLNRGLQLNQSWTKVQLPFVAAESYAIGAAKFSFQFGHQIQKLRFANIQLQNFGQPRTLSPETNLFLNNINGTWGTAQSIEVAGQSFATAYQIETTSMPSSNWYLQAVERNQVGVANGDTMRVDFDVRAVAGTDPKVLVNMQRTDTYAGLFSQTIDLDSNWQHFSYDIVSTDDFASNGLQLVFNAGFGLQTIQVGGVTWTNLNNAVDLSDLPQQFPNASYAGRDAEDAWRADADARIENERMQEVQVQVLDANGQPVDGAVVSLRQVEHDFKFGSAISAFGGRLDPNGTAEALKYQSEIDRLFNAVVIENSMKWPNYLNNPQRGDDAADFAVDHDLYLRGHNVIWPSRENMPASVWAEYDSRAALDVDDADLWLAETINARIDQAVANFAGKASEWDLTNEPFDNNDVMAILGDEALVGWYERFRAADPTIKLALNDYAIFAANGANTAHRANFEYWLGLLSTAGVLDIIGEQSHYSDSNLTDIETFGGFLEDYNTRFNAAIAITEFDVNSLDEQLQADYLRDYMTMAFSQPAVEEFLHWGFWEDSHWLPNAALYRSDFSIKPNGQAYEDLVYGNWWTDVRGTTMDGSFATEAFLGTYDVLVQYNGVVYTANATVNASGATNLTINLPVEITSASVSLMGVAYGGARASYGGDTVAPDKQPLRPGETATALNYTNYYHGLNRVIVDIEQMPVVTLSASDFTFRVGNTADPTNWLELSSSSLIPLPSITVAQDAASATNRVTLEWPDKSITNTWLQVTVKATDFTGLDEDEVFYFGNQIADVYSTASEATRLRVSSVDVIKLRGNQSLGMNSAAIDSVYDVNRDGRVTSYDVITARANQVLSGGLLMFTAPGTSVVPPNNLSTITTGLDLFAVSVKSTVVSPANRLSRLDAEPSPEKETVTKVSTFATSDLAPLKAPQSQPLENRVLQPEYVDASLNELTLASSERMLF